MSASSTNFKFRQVSPGVLLNVIVVKVDITEMWPSNSTMEEMSLIHYIQLGSQFNIKEENVPVLHMMSKPWLQIFVPIGPRPSVMYTTCFVFGFGYSRTAFLAYQHSHLCHTQKSNLDESNLREAIPSSALRKDFRESGFILKENMTSMLKLPWGVLERTGLAKLPHFVE